MNDTSFAGEFRVGRKYYKKTNKSDKPNMCKNLLDMKT